MSGTVAYRRAAGNALPAEPPAWVRRWIGLPFKLGGRGPRAFDCWGLARAVLAEEFDIRLPRYDRGYPETEGDRAALASLVRDGMPGWYAVERPAAGDLALLRHGAHACHIGVVVGRGWMLHIEHGTDSAIDRTDGPRWSRRLVGFYMFDGAAGC
ncbi:MAG: phage tail protein [Inquilinus sp.]|nr:phage tail protein [Inquilinus sp.]